jgi:hypothetical protein
MAVAKQLQALEILLGLSEQAVAHAGSPVVAVLTASVYVAQNASPDATTRLAQASVLVFVHPSTRGTMTLKRVIDRMFNSASINVECLETVT